MEKDENDRIIIDKKELQLGNRKVEVRLIECAVNQWGFRGQRIYARFKESKKVSVGRNVLSSEQIKNLRRVSDEMPDEEIFEDLNNGQDASAIVRKEEGRVSIEFPVSGSSQNPDAKDMEKEI